MGDQAKPVFGRYQTTSVAGDGSLGIVYRARHVDSGREVAIKDLWPAIATTSATFHRLRSEAEIVERIDHPNLVAVYEFVEEPARAWLAERWVDGLPLDELLDRHGRLTAEQALGVLTGVLAGLACAHAAGAVHGDIAASNVYLDRAGASMLGDFGLAAPVRGLCSRPPGVVLGCPSYLSPEAARGAPVDQRSDVYSIAALAFHLLEGRVLFDGSAWERVEAHREAGPPTSGHGPALADLLARSLAKEASRRPADAGALLDELEDAAVATYGAQWRARSSLTEAIALSMAATVDAGGAQRPVVASAEGSPVARGRPALSVAVAASVTAVIAASVTLSPRLSLDASLAARERDAGTGGAGEGSSIGREADQRSQVRPDGAIAPAIGHRAARSIGTVEPAQLCAAIAGPGVDELVGRSDTPAWRRDDEMVGRSGCRRRGAYGELAVTWRPGDGTAALQTREAVEGSGCRSVAVRPSEADVGPLYTGVASVSLCGGADRARAHRSASILVVIRVGSDAMTCRLDTAADAVLSELQSTMVQSCWNAAERLST